MKLLKDRRDVIEALEEEHVLDEFDVGVESLVEMCDDFIDASKAIEFIYNSEDESDDFARVSKRWELEDEREDRIDHCEDMLSECLVPKPVWDELFCGNKKRKISQ
jgi:predicted adenine nucleotide alpha hydrolase (AANH) superfamily ATPase